MKKQPGIARLWLCAWMLPLAFAPMYAPAQDAAPQLSTPESGPPVTLRGVVTNEVTGSPLARVKVEIFGNPVHAALTDGEGRFEFHNVARGAQNIQVRKPGFERRNDPEAGDTPLTVHVTDPMPELNIALQPLNAIYGHITLSTGVPAQGVGINLLRQISDDGRQRWNQVDSHSAAPDGSFRFYGMSDGTYLLQTQPEFDNNRATAPACAAGAPAEIPGYAAVFSNSVTAIASAAPVTASGGQGAEVNVALTQTKFYRVQVTVAHAPGGQWRLMQTLLDSFGQEVDYPVHAEKDQSLCVYLPNGSYTLMVQASQEGGLEAAQMRIGREGRVIGAPRANPDSLAGVLEFAVDGRAPGNLHVALTQAGATPVHVHFSPAPPKPAQPGKDDSDAFAGNLMTFAVQRVNDIGMNSEQASSVNDNDITNWELDTVAPGSYWVSASVSRNGVCMGSVTSGGQSLARVPWAARNTGTGSPIDVELRTDCAKLEVSIPVTMVAENGQGAVYVYAVPEFDSVDGLSATQIDIFGERTAKLDDLTPGRYRVYAFRSQRSIPFHVPGALDRLGAGQEVTLEPGGSSTLTLEGITE